MKQSFQNSQQGGAQAWEGFLPPHLQVIMHWKTGGEGEIFLVRRQGFAEGQLLKLSFDTAGQSRLEKEAQILHSIQGKGVSQVIEFQKSSRASYLCTSFAEGCTFRECGAVPADILATAVLDVAEALERLHQSGNVHGDLSPDNVILHEDGSGFLLDFGLSRGIGEIQNQGTPAFHSPEHCSSDPLKKSSDLFSFGSLCYFALTQSEPFGVGGDETAFRIVQVRNAEANALEVSWDGVSPTWKKLILRCWGVTSAELSPIEDFDELCDELDILLKANAEQEKSQGTFLAGITREYEKRFCTGLVKDIEYLISHGKPAVPAERDYAGAMNVQDRLAMAHAKARGGLERHPEEERFLQLLEEVGNRLLKKQQKISGIWTLLSVGVLLLILAFGLYNWSSKSFDHDPYADDGPRQILRSFRNTEIKLKPRQSSGSAEVPSNEEAVVDSSALKWKKIWFDDADLYSEMTVDGEAVQSPAFLKAGKFHFVGTLKESGVKVCKKLIVPATNAPHTIETVDCIQKDK